MGHAGSGEPPFTKGTSNTWWFNWNDPGGAGYYVKFELKVNGSVIRTEQTAASPGCGGAGQYGSSTLWDNQTGLVLRDRHTTCAPTEYYSTAGLPVEPGMSDCMITTMDTLGSVGLHQHQRHCQLHE